MRTCSKIFHFVFFPKDFTSSPILVLMIVEHNHRTGVVLNGLSSYHKIYERTIKSLRAMLCQRNTHKIQNIYHAPIQRRTSACMYAVVVWYVFFYLCILTKDKSTTQVSFNRYTDRKLENWKFIYILRERFVTTIRGAGGPRKSYYYYYK